MPRNDDFKCRFRNFIVLFLYVYKHRDVAQKTVRCRCARVILDSMNRRKSARFRREGDGSNPFTPTISVMKW